MAPRDWILELGSLSSTLRAITKSASLSIEPLLFGFTKHNRLFFLSLCPNRTDPSLSQLFSQDLLSPTTRWTNSGPISIIKLRLDIFCYLPTSPKVCPPIVCLGNSTVMPTHHHQRWHYRQPPQTSPSRPKQCQVWSTSPTTSTFIVDNMKLLHLAANTARFWFNPQLGIELLPNLVCSRLTHSKP